MNKYKSIILLLFILLICVISLTSCSFFEKKETQRSNNDVETKTSNGGEITPEAKDTTVEDLLKQMTLDEKIYQMLFVTPESLTGVGQVITAGDTTKNALMQQPVGGLIYFAENLQDMNQITCLIQNTQSYSKIPLFIGVDEEGGRVSRLGDNSLTGVSKFPSMKSIGETQDSSQAYLVGETIGKEISKLGFNVDFAPVADVLINYDNTEIGDRSFGTNPNDVSEMVEKVVTGLQKNNVSSVLKHFPGHGSTLVNSHHGYSESTRTLEEFRENEFLPFKAGIKAGSDFVMVSHATYVNATNEKCPASLSKEIITGFLLEELEFKGIVITDSFSMGAITNNYTTESAVVKAVNAGVDMILMPQSINRAFTGIKDAVTNGEITVDRINESVMKILSIKHKNGLF